MLLGKQQLKKKTHHDVTLLMKN